MKPSTRLSRKHGSIFFAALASAVLGCGATDDGTSAPTDQAAVSATAGELSGCPSSTRQLVCGTDGRTHTNICRAGGIARVAHIGACAGFNCNGVVCVAGFTCRTATNFGVSTDQCVSDTGEPPACDCPNGEACTVEPSGATSCAPPAREAAPADVSSLCANWKCPPATHCEITTINFGVPAPSCMYD